jgi:hypothetical protein
MESPSRIAMTLSKASSMVMSATSNDNTVVGAAILSNLLEVYCIDAW